MARRSCLKKTMKKSDQKRKSRTVMHTFRLVACFQVLRFGTCKAAAAIAP